MAKQSIFGRISQLLRANINALLDSAEDPQMMLDQLVRDYTNSIADAESAIAETIGNLRLLERDHAGRRGGGRRMGQQGHRGEPQGRRAARRRQHGRRRQVRQPRQDRARQQISSENEAKAAEPTIASQTEVVDKLKAGLDGDEGEARRAATRSGTS